uniref:Reverse transcriptase domain-containing protein n=1 Tax=Tanacetum cinerariifolium TaxID=118510 RepID=A0A6L2MN64_TANCI|nr:hypothetical protein [Tanacetum cinerariifolium]
MAKRLLALTGQRLNATTAIGEAKEGLTNFALMAYTSQGLESLEARILVHEKNEVIYKEDIAFLKYDVQVKDISIKELKNLLENALKEKDDLKLKLERFETSSKNLTKLINSQISVIDKTGIGYDGQMNESYLNDIHVNENEVLNNVFDCHESDGDDNQVNDMFKEFEGYHVVPPPYTGNYMPPRADLSFAGLDNYVFKSRVCETITSVSKIETNASKIPQFPLNYESEPGYIENYNSYPYDSSSFPQQYPFCEDCGGLSKADHYQPPQYTVNHPIFNAHNDILNANNDLLNSQNKITITQNKLMEKLTSMCAMVGQLIQKKQEEKHEEEQAANARYRKIPACSTESDEFIKSCVENLVLNLSESEGENGCDVPACFTTFSNILFNADYEFDSVDDQSCSDEDVSDKIFSNLLFEEEIISMRIDPHHFNAESDLIESLLNHDSSIIPSSSKIDFLLDEFAGELTLLKSIPPGVDETNCYPENEIRFTKRLLYDNSSPHLPKEVVSENSNAEIESFSPSPIPIKDSDSFMEEIDLSFNPDDPIPPGIEEDDDESERDILILEELLDNYSVSLPENKSYHFDIPSFSRPPAKPLDDNTGILNIKMMGDISEQNVPMPRLTITQLLDIYSLSLPTNESYHFDIPSPYRPPAKPPDGITGTLNIKMMGDVSDQKVPIPNLTITRILSQEKSPDLFSHLGLEAFQPSTECPMSINGKNIPLSDVPLFHFYPP